ncbi:MAG: hypothetical protein U0V56_12980 [Actinomycetota bacterium]
MTQKRFKPIFAPSVNGRTIVLSLGVGAAGLLLPGLVDEFANLGEVGSARVAAVGASLLTLGVFGFAYEVALRRSVVLEVLRQAGLSRELASSGLVQVGSMPDIDFHAFLTSGAGEIEVCAAYARRWVLAHADEAVRQGAKEGRDLQVIMLGEQAPVDVRSVYARRGPERTSELIRETIDEWQAAVDRLRGEGETARVQLWEATKPFPYIYFRHGDDMWVVIHSRADRPHLAIRCVRTNRSDGFFEWILDDIRREKESGEIKPAAKLAPHDAS